MKIATVLLLVALSPAWAQSQAERIEAMLGPSIGTFMFDWPAEDRVIADRALEEAKKAKLGVNDQPLLVGRIERMQNKLRDFSPTQPTILLRFGALGLGTGIGVSFHPNVIDQDGKPHALPLEFTRIETTTMSLVLSSAWCYWGYQDIDLRWPQNKRNAIRHCFLTNRDTVGLYSRMMDAAISHYDHRGEAQ